MMNQCFLKEMQFSPLLLTCIVLGDIENNRLPVWAKRLSIRCGSPCRMKMKLRCKDFLLPSICDWRWVVLIATALECNPGWSPHRPLAGADVRCARRAAARESSTGCELRSAAGDQRLKGENPPPLVVIRCNFGAVRQWHAQTWRKEGATQIISEMIVTRRETTNNYLLIKLTYLPILRPVRGANSAFS